jgi:hypothetical protein
MSDWSQAFILIFGLMAMFCVFMVGFTLLKPMEMYRRSDSREAGYWILLCGLCMASAFIVGVTG